MTIDERTIRQIVEIMDAGLVGPGTTQLVTQKTDPLSTSKIGLTPYEPEMPVSIFDSTHRRLRPLTRAASVYVKRFDR